MTQNQTSTLFAILVEIAWFLSFWSKSLWMSVFYAKTGHFSFKSFQKYWFYHIIGWMLSWKKRCMLIMCTILTVLWWKELKNDSFVGMLSFPKTCLYFRVPKFGTELSPALWTKVKNFKLWNFILCNLYEISLDISQYFHRMGVAKTGPVT